MTTAAELTGLDVSTAAPVPLVDEEILVADSTASAKTSYFYNQDPQTKAHVHYSTGM